MITWIISMTAILFFGWGTLVGWCLGYGYAHDWFKKVKASGESKA